ncbi:trypsin-like peptidase domain-containing protein, partial [Candidatus Babeliales bacterium]|nr:trypsin-like peptidase domain-containing protein [Candidatus Babeliales bacterium]
EDSIELIEKECGDIVELEFGSSDQMRRGDKVFTLGFPFGEENLKGTQGVISGYQNVYLQQNEFNRLCLQITAPINNGNSGGPAFNDAGKVIGINFAAFAEAQNVGYVIPIDGVKDVLKHMFSSKFVRNPCLGGVMQPMTPTMAKALKCPEGVTGVLVVNVFENGSLGLLGIKPGDVIVEVNGHVVDFQGEVAVSWSDERVDMREVVNRMPFGHIVSCKVCRNGEMILLEMEKKHVGILPVRTLFPRHERVDYEIFGGGLVVMPLSINRIIQLREHTPTLLSHLILINNGKGKLVVSYVLPTSKASDPRGLFRIGTVITHINGIEIFTLDEFRKEIEKCLINEEFITITSDFGLKDVFESKSVLKDELRLSNMFSYPKEHSVGLCMAERINACAANQ